MLGTFQRSTIRIEVEATALTLQRCLVETSRIRQWLGPQQLAPETPPRLEVGTEFTACLGPVAIHHRVEQLDLDPGQMQLLLWGALDGFQQWAWGNGWVQSRVEAITVLPLSLGQWLTLRQLQTFARKLEAESLKAS